MFNSSFGKWFYACGIALLAMAAAESHATVVKIDSANSVIHTGGGLAGGGYGDLTLSGTFDVAVSDSVLLFSNFNIQIQPALASPDVTAATLLGDMAFYADGYHFQMAYLCDFGMTCPTSQISGTYDGSNFSLTGFYFSGIADDYSYTTQLNASAVPVPASAWLLGSALMGMGGLARRRNSISK
jgi:hypothetical protein